MHYGWVVVGAAFTVLFLAYGVQYAFGLFFTALTEEFGWSRASLSGVFSLYAASYAFFGLFAGRLTDRWGPRAVVALGGGFLGLGLGLSGGVQNLAPLYATYLVAAVGMSTAYVPCTATVARWFAARRGLAVGLAMSGASLGTFAVPPLVALLLAEVGWRRAYVLLGVGLALSLGLLAGLFVRDPRDRELAPYGVGPPAAPTTTLENGWPLRRIVRHRSFALLVATYMMTWTPVFMPPCISCRWRAIWASRQSWGRRRSPRSAPDPSRAASPWVRSRTRWVPDRRWRSRLPSRRSPSRVSPELSDP